MKDITIILIKASWCGHCNRFAPIFEETENKAKGMLKALSMANYFSKIKGKKVNDFSNR